MNKEQLLDILEQLKIQGGLEALLPQNIPNEIFNELYEVSKEIPGDIYGESSDIFRIYTTWFLHGRKLNMILPSVMIKKIQILFLALSAEKLRREKRTNMKPWPLPDIDNLFDDRDVNFYFYQISPKIVSSSNPLRIVDDPNLNKHHRLSNLVSSFEKGLMAYFEAYKNMRGEVTVDEFIKVIVYYTIDLLIEYRDNAGNMLPTSIIEDTKHQIISALKNNFEVFNQQQKIDKIYTQIDKKIYEANIVTETENYLRNLRNYG